MFDARVRHEILCELFEALGTMPAKSASSCKLRGLFRDKLVYFSIVRRALLKWHVWIFSINQLCHLLIVDKYLDS